MPLLWLSVSFVAGIWLSSQVPLPAFVWVCLAAGAGLLLAASRVFRRVFVDYPGLVNRVISIFPPRLLQRILKPVNLLRSTRSGIAFPWLLVSIFIGTARYQAVQPVLTDASLSRFNDTHQAVHLVGVVTAFPDVRDGYSLLDISVESIKFEDAGPDTLVTGMVLARVETGPAVGMVWQYGDRVKLQGVMRTPGENELFSYRDYLEKRGIFSVMSPEKIERLAVGDGNPILARLYTLREQARAVIYQLYPDPEASLLAGILLGLERGIPAEVSRAFQATGTAHIIAISGFNMSLLAGLCTALFAKRLGKGRGALAALLTIGLYTVLVGAQAAVVRAAVMSGLAVFAMQVGRRQAGLNSLALTAALMACIQPFVLWDVGFQLSVSATLGLVLFGESWPRAFQRWLGRWLAPVAAKRAADVVGEYLLLTLAAQLMTLPVIVFHFRRFSLVSLLANPLVLPVQPMVMILGGLSLLGGLVWLPAGRLLAYAAWPLTAFTIRAVETLSKLPGAEWTLPPISLAWVVVFYSLVLGWVLAQRTLRGIGLKVGPAAFLAGIALVTIQVWRIAWAAPDGLLHLTLLNVNHNGNSGEALLVESPDGRFVLVNGGPSFTRLSDSLGRRLDAAGSGLDWVVVGGVEDEELRVLPEIIERYPPQGIIWGRAENTGWYSRQLQAVLIERDIPLKIPLPGLSLDLNQGAVFEVLQADQDGMVVLVRMGRFKALLPLGRGMAGSYPDFAGDIGKITVLLLAEAGDKSANPPEWLPVFDPQVVLLSVAAADRYGLPDAELMEEVSSYNVLRTDRNGWIEITTDGEQIWVEVEKKPRR